MRMKKIPVLVIAVWIGACTSKSPGNGSNVNSEELPAYDSATVVTTSVLHNKEFEYYINSNGTIKSLRENIIYSEAGGKVLKINAKEGAYFTEGALLAQMETIALKFRLERAQLSKFNYQKEYESQLLGYENLLTNKSAEEINQIKQKLKISSGLAGAEQDIKEINYQLNEASFKAPFSGVIADVKVQEGQQLKNQEQLFKIYDPKSLLLSIKILESEITSLRIGMKATIATISSPENNYKAVVYKINPYVDENGMADVILRFEHIKLQGEKNISLLYPGMNCTATISLPQIITLSVPKDAIIIHNNKPVVFTLEDGKAKWNYVTTGLDNGTEVQIKEGLSEGQKIIISNNLQLGHDVIVKEKL